MFDFLRWSATKHDAAPGSLVYAGENRDFEPYAFRLIYTPETVREERFDSLETLSPTREGTSLTVIVGIHSPEGIRHVGTAFGYPVLALEDVMNTGQRSKLTWVNDETGFIVMKNLEVTDGQMHSEQVSLFWHDHSVVVFLQDRPDVLDSVIARIRKGKGRIRGAGGAYLMTAVLDTLVDRQLGSLAALSETAEVIESEMLNTITDKVLGRLYALKRETILLRNSLLPVREIFKALQREDAEVPENALPYLRDVAGHSEQAIEGAAALHDILTSMIDYQISLIGIRTNKVMQLLTVIATIFIPLTFIAGIYGMNFDFMPELHWKFGYFIALGVMGGVAAVMLYYFSRKKLL